MSDALTLHFPDELAALATFCERALLRISNIEDGKYRQLYSREENLDHYEQLAIELQNQFHSPAFSQAAFLHGVSGQDVIEHLEDMLDPETRTILQGLMQLLALDEMDRDVTRQLEQNVLPVIDCRAAFLMILERLHHLDPDGRFSRWTRSFQREPTAVPEGLPSEPVFWTRLSIEQYVAFLRSLVAPTCKYFGLFHEHHLAENAALWLENPQRFREIVRFAMEVQDRLAPIIDSRAWKLPDWNVRWEWQHTGNMDRNLLDNPPFKTSHLAGCGWITVITEHERDTYLALHQVLSRFSCRNPRFEGLHDSHQGGYRAIHLSVKPVDQQLGVKFFRARLISHEAYECRFNRPLPAMLDDAISAQDDPIETLRVFAPDGRPIDLPRKSVVLNFAMAIYKGFVCRVRRAEVNRVRVGIFYPLHHGDVVRLLPDVSILPLPPGWEKKVPEETVRSIRKQYKEQYNRELTRQGLLWLRARLVKRGVAGLPDGDDFARYVALRLEALRREGVVVRKHSEHRDISWLLRQLGLFSARAADKELLWGDKPLFPLLVDRQRCTRVVDVMEDELKRTRPRYVLDLPEHMGAFDRQVCPRCEPSQYEPYVGVVQGEAVVYHLPNAPCIKQADGETYQAFRSPMLTSVRPYILVQTNSRPGMAADVFGVFKELEISIDELAGCRLGEGLGVIRLQMEAGPRISVPEILNKLGDIKGVNRVRELGERPDTTESHLPERMEGRERLWTQLIPYLAGPKVLGDRYFYGRDEELSELLGAFDRAHRGGSSLFIKGPRHIGKSSLLHRFLRILRRRYTRTCVTADYEFTLGETWDTVKGELAKVLRDRARAIAQLSDIPFAPSPDLPLQDLVEAIRTGLGFSVVIAVDEVAGLFNQASGGPGEQAIVKLDGWAASHPGVLLCWCGLEGPVRTLSPPLEHVLRRAQPITLREFDAVTTQRMLRAEKMAPRHPIEVSEEMARAVAHDTAGNPFWVAHVGTLMWGLARRRGERVVRYMDSDLSRAQKMLLGDPVTFGERLLFFEDSVEVREMANAIMLQLSRLLLDEARGLTPLEIFHHLQQVDLLPHQHSLQQLTSGLETMEEIGALSRYASEENERWRVSAPILARYVLKTMTHKPRPTTTTKNE